MSSQRRLGSPSVEPLGSRRRASGSGASVALMLLIAAGSRDAAAQSASGATTSGASGGELEWAPANRRVGWPEYVATPLLLLWPTFDSRLLGSVTEPHWQGPVLFDAYFHNEVRADNDAARRSAGDISDLLLTGGALSTFVIDNLVVAWGLRGSLDVAWQMTVINAQALGLATFATRVTKRFAARERPYGQECDIDPNFASGCTTTDRFRSFFSGHAATHSTFAGLTCAHHLRLGLYGDPKADGGMCAASVALSLTTGTLRLISSNHWLSDVLVGELVGFSIGYFMPTLLYYRADAASRSADAGVAVVPLLGPGQTGLSLIGRL